MSTQVKVAASGGVLAAGLAMCFFLPRLSNVESPSDVMSRMHERIREPVTQGFIDYNQTDRAIRNYQQSLATTALAITRITRFETASGTSSGEQAILVQLPHRNALLSAGKIGEVRAVLETLRTTIAEKRCEEPDYLKALLSAREELADIIESAAPNGTLESIEAKFSLGSTEHRITTLLRSLLQSGAAVFNQGNARVEVNDSAGTRIFVSCSAIESADGSAPTVRLDVTGLGMAFSVDMQTQYLARAELMTEALLATSPIFNPSVNVSNGLSQAAPSQQGRNLWFALRRDQLCALLLQH